MSSTTSAQEALIRQINYCMKTIQAGLMDIRNLQNESLHRSLTHGDCATDLVIFNISQELEGHYASAQAKFQELALITQDGGQQPPYMILWEANMQTLKEVMINLKK